MTYKITQASKVAVGFFTLALFGACAPAGALSSVAAQAALESTKVQGADLFTELSPEVAGANLLGADSSIRERRVSVDVAKLTSLLRVGQTVQLNLFTNRVVEVVITSVDSPRAGNVIATGSLKDDALASVTLVVNDGVLVGSVRPSDGDESYEIRTTTEGQVVRAVRDDGDMECEEAHDEAPSEKSLTSDDESVSPMAAPVIDVLVAYTPNARANAGGTAGMMALIQQGIADTNAAFRDSGASLTVRLAGTLETKQNESGNYLRDLTSLKNKGDGRWDEVHAKRDQVHADQVSLIGVFNNGSATAGIGYKDARDDSAFTVTKMGAFKYYTFSHELGHNLGLDHADGYVNYAARFRTIMAYGNPVRIRRYSNPSISYNGSRTGDSRHNEVAIMNRNASKLAAFR